MARSQLEKAVTAAAPAASRLPCLDGLAVSGEAAPFGPAPERRAAPQSGDCG